MSMTRNTSLTRAFTFNSSWTTIGIDYVRLLLRTKQSNRYIIIAMEYLTKWVKATAVSDCTAQTTAQFIFQEIVCRYGTLKEILTDRTTSFQN